MCLDDCDRCVRVDALQKDLSKARRVMLKCPFCNTKFDPHRKLYETAPEQDFCPGCYRLTSEIVAQMDRETPNPECERCEDVDRLQDKLAIVEELLTRAESNECTEDDCGYLEEAKQQMGQIAIRMDAVEEAFEEIANVDIYGALRADTPEEVRTAIGEVMAELEVTILAVRHAWHNIPDLSF